MTRDGRQGLYLGAVETALAQVWARWEHLLDQLGGVVPAGQLRAVLVIDASGASPVTGLARRLGISVSGASRLCDYLEAAGLVAWELVARTDLQLAVTVTEAGQRLAAWVRDQRRADLARGLATMSTADRQALACGLGKLAALSRNKHPGDNTPQSAYRPPQWPSRRGPGPLADQWNGPSRKWTSSEPKAVAASRGVARRQDGQSGRTPRQHSTSAVPGPQPRDMQPSEPHPHVSRGDQLQRVTDARERAADQRDQAAGERDQAAGERDQAADERERIADQREQLADDRERAADRREAELDKLRTALGLQVASIRKSTGQAVARANAAIARSKAALERDEAAIQREQRERIAAQWKAGQAQRARAEIDRRHLDAMTQARSTVERTRALRAARAKPDHTEPADANHPGQRTASDGFGDI